jgi:hypothetical protein
MLADAADVAHIIDDAAVEDLSITNGNDRSLEDVTVDVLQRIGWLEP